MDKERKIRYITLIVTAVILCLCTAVNLIVLKTADKAANTPDFGRTDTQFQTEVLPAESSNQTAKTIAAENTVSEMKTQNESSEPTVTVTDMSAVMYSTISNLNVRSKAGNNGEIIGTLDTETAVNVTGKCSNGWMRIEYKGGIGYCYGKYLANEKKSEQPVQNTYPYHIRVNRLQNVVIIFELDENGEYTVPVKAMVCSVGKNGKTPTGTFSLSDKYVWGALSGGVYGQYCSRITGHYLFHSVPYFSKDKGNLQFEKYNKLGQEASLGCIRLTVADAKWIFDNCKKGTAVTIYDSSEPEPLSKPEPITIDTSDPRRGWDPTDPDPNNPW